MRSPVYQEPHNSILVAGIVLVVYETIILIIYFLAGSAVMDVLTAIFGISNVASQMGTYSPTILTVFNMMFAVAFLLPVAYFFVWIWRKEQGFQYRRF